MCARRHQRGGCERRGGDKRDRASIERSSGCFLVARIVGRKSTRRDLAIDAARRVAKGRAPRVVWTTHPVSVAFAAPVIAAHFGEA